MKLYNFDGRTVTGSTTFFIDATAEEMDTSFVLLYYNPSDASETAWYPIPGAGPSNRYETRYLIFESTPGQYSFRVFLEDPATGASYTTPVRWNRTRVFVIPAGSVMGRQIDSGQIDTSNFQLVEEMVGQEGL